MDQSTGPIDTKSSLIGYPHITEGSQGPIKRPNVQYSLYWLALQNKENSCANQKVLYTNYKVHAYWISGTNHRTKFLSFWLAS
jgi:hypothetical protein